MNGNRRFGTGLLRGPALLAVAVCLCGITAIALADRFPPDPVEDLRLTLKATLRNPEPRERNLKKRVEALWTLGQMRRALVLQEWQDEGDDKIAAIDQPVRKELATRFAEGLRAALTSSDVTSRRAAAEMLAEIGISIRGVGSKSGLARDLAPDLAARLKDDVPAVREIAARALSLINPDPNEAVPALAGVLGAATVPERRAAAEALAELMRAATTNSTRSSSTTSVSVTPEDVVELGKAVVPVAARALGDSSPLVRRASADALLQSAQAVRKQVTETRSGDEVGAVDEYRKEVEGERTRLAPLMAALKQAASILAKAVTDPDLETRVSARRTLEEMGEARENLLKRAQRLATAEAEIKMGNGKDKDKDKSESPLIPEDYLLDGLKEALPALAEGLSDSDEGARLSAVDALEKLGKAAAPAAPALVKALDDKDRFVRWASARVLGRIGRVDTVDAVPALVRMLQHPDLDLCRAAAMALERLGPQARRAVPTLISRLTASDAELRVAVIRTLEGIGTDSQPAIPALSAALADRDARVRQTAAEALGKFGPAAQEAVPALRQALTDDDAEVRKTVSDALLSILTPKK